MWLPVQKATFFSSKWREERTSPESRTSARKISIYDGNLGDPRGLFIYDEEYGVQVIIKRGNQMPIRKSDNSVVPMKLGNADGGKAVT